MLERIWRKGNPLTLLVGMQTSIATILVLEKFSLVLEKKKSLVLEKAEEPEIKLPTSPGSWTKQETSRKTFICFNDYDKAFDCVDHNKLWILLKEMGIPDLPLEKSVCRSGSNS